MVRISRGASVAEEAEEARQEQEQKELDWASEEENVNDTSLRGRCKKKCGLTAQTITGVVMGFVIGIAIREADPSETTIQLLGYLGELFVNALKMVVVPLIATGMVMAIVKLGDISKIKTIGTRALLYYMLTTFLAAIEGLIWVNLFNPGGGTAAGAAVGEAIGQGAACIHRSNHFCDTLDALAVSIASSSMDGAVVNASRVVPGACESMVPKICNQQVKKETLDAFLDIGRSMLPANLVVAYQETNIIGIIVFCLVFGFYLARQPNAQPAMDVIGAANTALMEMVNLIIVFTPIGVGSLVCGEVVKQPNLWADFAQLGLFIVTVVVGELVHALIVYPAIYATVTRTNPYKVLKTLSAPMCTAFATSSSAATLPVTIQAVEANGVHEDISRFMLPLGATINMDGTAIYFPVAVIFIANWTGQGPIGFADQLSIAFVSAFVSIGAAPIPSAGLVYLLLIMSSAGITVTGKVSLVLAIDWFLDRLQTMCNVTGDSMGANLLEFLRKRDERNKVA